MSYNPNIHHRRTIRLKGYDYSRTGLYFITICAQDRACLFGEIVGAPLVGAQNNTIQNGGDVQNDGHAQNNGIAQNARAIQNDGHVQNDGVVQNVRDVQNNCDVQIETDNGNDVGRLDDMGRPDIGRPHIGRPQGHAPTVATMILNDAGKMVETEWLKLTERFPNIELHEYVAMPNHFHGILQIVDTSTAGKTVGDMIDAIKWITTVEYVLGVKQSGWEPFNGKLWQRNYWDHVIRDEQSACSNYFSEANQLAVRFIP